MATISGKDFFGGGAGIVVKPATGAAFMPQAAQQQATPQETEPKEAPDTGSAIADYFKGFIEAPQKVWQDYQGAAQEIVSAPQEGAELIAKGGPVSGLRGVVRSATGAAGAAAGAAFSPIGRAAEAVIPGTGPLSRTAQGALAGAVLGGPMGAAVGGGMGLAFSGYEAAKKMLLSHPKIAEIAAANPDIEKDLDNILTIGLSSIGQRAAKGTAPKGQPDIMSIPIRQVPGRVKANIAAFGEIPGAVARAAITAKDIGTGKVSEIIGNAQNYVARKNAPENLAASVDRLATTVTKDKKGQTIRRDPLKTYDEFYDQEQKFKTDAKQDTAISVVGERMGDAYESVVRMRRAAGAKMSDEMKIAGDKKVDISNGFTTIEGELANSGLRYDAETGTLFRTKTSKVTTQDRRIVQKYFDELSQLGTNPTAAELDAFLSRIPAELDVYKQKNNITSVTNGERIVKQNLQELGKSLTPETDPAFAGYAQAKKDYATLSGFLDEGASYLGKKTQSGDYAKDASMAKSAVQSVLNNGKKDWMLKLEDLTGYPALDEAVLAIQAMKDAGNFRGNSLLELLTPKEAPSVPTSKGQIIMRAANKAVEVAERKMSGTPREQTRRFMTEKAKAEEVKNFARDKSLSPEDMKLQESAIEKFVGNKQGLVDDFIKKHGKVANTDEARKSFEGYKGVNAAAFQEAASEMTKMVFRQNLKNNPGQLGVLYAGGGGTGKTSAIRNLLPNVMDDAAAILDGNLSSIKSARARIGEIVDAGKTPEIIYVYRNPIESFVEGVVKRMNFNEGEMGRIVPTKVLADNHIGSFDTVRQLAQDGNVKINYVNNSLGPKNARIMTPEEFANIKYPTKERLTQILNERAKELYENGTITKDQYEAYIR